MSNQFPIVVLHNVSAASRVQEFTNIALGLGYKTVIITNPQGSAAQRGIPTAQKAAYKEKANFMVLENLETVKELFSADEFFVIAPPPYGKETLDNDLVDSVEGKKIIIAVGGNDSGLSRMDLDLGRSVQLPVGKIGSIGMATLALAKFKRII